MAITSPGLGSNLDVNSIVGQLMAIEQRPATKLNQKEAVYQARLSAIGTLKGVISTLQSAISGLKTESKFAATTKATADDSSVVTVSAGKTAASGLNFSVTVDQLAQAQKLKSGVFASTTASVGSGTLSIQFGSVADGAFTANGERSALTISIAPGEDSLTDIRDAINAKNAGVTATIVNDGTGYRLALSSSFSGSANNLRITTTDDDGTDTDTSGLSRFAFDPADPTPADAGKMSQTVAARDALLSIDGIAIVKSSNTISDAIDGITLTLLKEGGATTKVGTSRDTSGIKGSVESFIKAYNDANKTLRELSAYDPATKQAGPLQGDPSVRTLQAQLRSVVGSSLKFPGSGLSNLSDIGVAFQKDGSLALDGTKLQAAIDAGKDIATLFTGVAKASDKFISVVSTGKNAIPGKYDVNISQLATSGSASFTLDSATIVAGVNDSFTASIDDVSTTVTLAAGTYTAAALAAEIQSKLNGALGAGEASKLSAATANTSAMVTGTAVAALTVDELNDELSVTLNGVTHSGITLTQGSYTADSLAAELQSKINAAFAGDNLSVTVAQDAGVLSITSGSTGVGSTIGLAAENDDLFGAAPTAQAGTTQLTMTSTSVGEKSAVNGITFASASNITTVVGAALVGTIGGAPATASGDELTGTAGAAELTIKVSGTTLGDRGSITYDRGVASQLDVLLSGWLASDGAIKGKTDSTKASIEAIGRERETLGRRLEQIEARYRRQFTALDTLISGMTSTSNYLTQQLSQLSSLSKNS